MESFFLNNEECPKCRQKGNDRSGDNLAVYSDGHKYCWCCNYYISSTADPFRDVQHVRTDPIIKLPEDADTNYSHKAIDWIQQYDLNMKDLLTNHVLYSQRGTYLKKKDIQCNDLLIFPFWAKGELLGWQGRYFGSSTDVPKWIGRGQLNNIYHILKGNNSKKIVLTEDIVSAIKVNKGGHEAMPLFGINLKSRWGKLKLLGYQEAIIFLDPDMHTHMIKESRVGALEGFKTRVILSDKDPKEHSREEIQELLR